MENLPKLLVKSFLKIFHFLRNAQIERSKNVPKYPKDQRRYTHTYMNPDRAHQKGMFHAFPVAKKRPSHKPDPIPKINPDHGIGRRGSRKIQTKKRQYPMGQTASGTKQIGQFMKKTREPQTKATNKP